MNFAPFIRDYSLNGRVSSNEELAWHAGQPSLERAIKVAARAEREDHKRHAHQRCIRTEALREAEKALLAAKAQIRATRTFDALHDTIVETLAGVRHVGELYCYDTAMRIGAFLRLVPDRVYLHAGVREGARALGLNHTVPFLRMTDLPAALQKLTAHEVEDILCIYRDQMIKTTGCGSSPKWQARSPSRCGRQRSGCR